MKRVVCLSILSLFVFGVVGYSSAMDMGTCDMTGSKDASITAGNESKAVNVGNTICPVTGEKIDEAKKVTYEYKGKVYNFCCPGCPDEFKKDPEKYIGKIGKENAKAEGMSQN